MPVILSWLLIGGTFLALLAFWEILNLIYDLLEKKWRR